MKTEYNVIFENFSTDRYSIDLYIYKEFFDK